MNTILHEQQPVELRPVSTTRARILELARREARLPIGADLVLHEQPDVPGILRDGERLGRVIAEAAHRFQSPLAMPLMDLTLEKEWLLSALQVPAAQIPAFHFAGAVPVRMPDARLTARLRATTGALHYIAHETDLVPVGMCIGPFSLMTKLVADPITPVFLAGMGERDADVQRVEATLALALQVVVRSVVAQLSAGARAIMVCEPAANTTYFSPNQLAAGSDVFDRYVLALNRRLRTLLAEYGAELIFHDCGELTDDMVRAFGALAPAMLSLGSSRSLARDARLVPADVVLFGNLPTKKFYSDEAMPVAAVARQTRQLLREMRTTGHPFILGSECDVLSVPGRTAAIWEKVRTFLSCPVDEPPVG